MPRVACDRLTAHPSVDMTAPILSGGPAPSHPYAPWEPECCVSGFDVVVSDFSEGSSEALARVLERELGLDANQALAQAHSLPQTVLAGATRRVADQAALRLLSAGAHVAVRPSDRPPAMGRNPPPTGPATLAEAPHTSSAPAEAYQMGELEPTSLRPRSQPPMRVSSIVPALNDLAPVSSAPPRSAPASDPAGPRMFDEDLEGPTRGVLEIDEKALQTRNHYVRSERPEGWARRPALPVVPGPSVVARLLNLTLKWGVLGFALLLGWSVLNSSEAPAEDASFAAKSVRSINQFIAPARELTLRGLHVVHVTWPSDADGSEPRVRCLLVEAPAEKKLSVLRLAHTQLEIPSSVQAELDDHADVLRTALGRPELDLTPICLDD